MEDSTKNSPNKQQICQEISRLHAEVNELALRLSVNNSPEANYIWSNLANARAYLSTALEAARHVRNGKLDESRFDWQI